MMRFAIVCNQVLVLSLFEFGGCMSSVRWLHLLTRTHIQEAFVELSNFIRSKIHILAVLHDVVERLFLIEMKEDKVRTKYFLW